MVCVCGREELEQEEVEEEGGGGREEEEGIERSRRLWSGVKREGRVYVCSCLGEGRVEGVGGLGVVKGREK